MAVATGRVGAWLRERLPGAGTDSHRASRGPRRSRLFGAGGGRRRHPVGSGAARPSRPDAPALQPPPHSYDPGALPRRRACCLLRHRLPPGSPRRGGPVCHPGGPSIDEGVRRYGFHGLSYEYIARALPHVAPEISQGSVVVAHLGSGASMCAIKGGRSVDSTMAFTGLDGLPMGTRCGQIDPGVLLYLVSEKGYGAKELEHLLYHEAGLRGLSGISNDVRDLLASEDPRARLALDYFVYRVARELGALAAAMQGTDAVVLTAGISENSPEMRARICASAAWLGLRLDEACQSRGWPAHLHAGLKVSAWVIPTDEERMIAEHTLKVWQDQAVQKR